MRPDGRHDVLEVGLRRLERAYLGGRIDLEEFERQADRLIRDEPEDVLIMGLAGHVWTVQRRPSERLREALQ